MMKKLILGIFYFSWLTGGNAQVLAGKVVDQTTGLPLALVTTELNHSTTTLTNDSGYFVFPKTGKGPYHLRFSFIGYRTFQVVISKPGSRVLIKMEKIALFLQPVEVRALRAGDSAPFSKTNLGKRDIEKLNLGQDLPFLLDQTPSVVINSDAGNGIGYTGIRIRGTDATRINVTLNGIPYNDAESQGTFFVDLPDFASSVNSIQVQRGVGTSSNGAGAFGASINVSTNDTREKPYGEISSSYGSFDTWKNTVKAGSGLIDNHFTLDARLSKISSQGYIDRASSDLRSFYVSGAWLSEKTAVRLNVFSGKEKTYQAWYGVSESDLASNRRVNYAGTEKPGAPYNNETDNYQQDHYQLFINHSIHSSLTVNTAFFLTNGKGYYEQYKADQLLDDYGLPDFITGNDTLKQTDLIRQLWLNNRFYGQVFSLQYHEGPDNFQLGGGWNRYEGKHFGEVIWAQAGVPDHYTWYRHPAFKTDLNFYAKYQRNLLPQLKIFGDLQYRRVLYDIDGFQDNPALKVSNLYHFFNPKLGLTFSGKQFQAYLSWALGQKEPNRDDFEAGQQQIPKPEKLQDFEAGFEMKRSGFSWGATLYYMRYHDQLVLTGKINNVGAYTRTNIPESYRLGIEWQAKATLNSWLEVSGNLSLSKNRILNFAEYYDDYDNGGQKMIMHGNTDIALSPDIVFAGSPEIHPVHWLQVSFPAKYVGRQYLDNTSNKNRSLKPYYIQDILLRINLPGRWLKESVFSFRVNNLFNKMYAPNGYTYSYQLGGNLVTENYYYPMAGLNFLAALALKLE